jgi:hypothetical protein
MPYLFESIDMADRDYELMLSESYSCYSLQDLDVLRRIIIIHDICRNWNNSAGVTIDYGLNCQESGFEFREEKELPLFFTPYRPTPRPSSLLSNGYTRPLPPEFEVVEA